MLEILLHYRLFGKLYGKDLVALVTQKKLSDTFFLKNLREVFLAILNVDPSRKTLLAYDIPRDWPGKSF